MTPLYTWRDVERRLRLEESPSWYEASADLETLTLVCAPSARQAVQKQLAEIFGPRLLHDGKALELEATREAPRRLAVLIEESEPNGAPRQPVIRPLWLDAEKVPGPVASLPSGSPTLAAFYSYKGGVGRTTTLLATLGALLELRQPPVPVLVVDADLEAPGLTIDIPGLPDRFCLLDFLALVHDAEDWQREAIPLAAERLRRNREDLELRSGRASFYFLPAHRDDDHLFAPPLTMEQVVRARGRAHVVVEALSALGQAIGAEVVLVDLRAGITEFSSPLMLDPRVQTILVTSCGTQSTEGTIRVLGRMANRARRETRPEVVITMIPPGFKAEDTAELSGTLQSAIPAATENIAEELAVPNVHEARFAEQLVHFDSVRELIVDLAPGTDLGKRVAPRLASWLAPATIAPANVDVPATQALPTGLAAVATEAKKLEYAEGNAELGLLGTPALAALIEQFPRDVPAAVVLGAKGAGKTFAWGQMVLARNWQRFATLVANPAVPALVPPPASLIFPLLSPSNMQPEPAAKVREAERAVWAALGLKDRSARALLAGDALLAELGQKVSEELDELDFWTQRIAGRLGLQEGAGASVEALADALAERNASVCVVIDGLEDAFQPSPQEPLRPYQQRLLRGLLQRFTIKVRDLRSPNLGVVTFVRRDLAQAAIVQNFGQFEALHGRFSIVWTPTEALRLVAWLLNRAGFPGIARERIPLASYAELRDSLKGFWGERMGSKKSREAYTDLWVIAALSDFQGRLQARDLVRLVRHAAESVPDEPRLTPRSLRDALAKCSKAKIEELSKEIPGLEPMFERFRQAPKERRRIPFHREDFGLSSEEVSFLETQGIVIRVEQDELYLPEIVRHGLEFGLDGKGRAKVLALWRAAQAKRL